MSHKDKRRTHKDTRMEGAGQLIHTLRHLLLFHRRAKTQAEEAEQQKLEMETLAERLVEADKRGDLAEKGFYDHNIYDKREEMLLKKGRINDDHKIYEKGTNTVIHSI